MRHRLELLGGRLTYANVVASIALMLALGGTSYAVSRIPARSVGTKQLKKNAVNSSRVRDGSLLGADFQAGQLPAGAPGPAGADGVIGPRGPSDAFQNSNSGSLSLGSPIAPTTLASLSLPAGSYVVEGQATVDNADNTNSGTAICFLLRPAGTFFSVIREGLDKNTTEDDRATAAPIGALTLASPGVVTLSCSYEATGSINITAADRRLVATQVATLTTQ